MRFCSNIQGKSAILISLFIISLLLKYAWLINPKFSESYWVSALGIHICYLPIILAAIWYGFRGGLIIAAIMAVISFPLTWGFWNFSNNAGDISIGIVFYFVIALMIGRLLDIKSHNTKKRESNLKAIEKTKRHNQTRRIAAGVAKEVKEPLDSIRKSIETFNDESTSDNDKQRLLQDMLNRIGKLDNTMTEFISFGYPKDSRMESLNLSEIIKDSIKQIEPFAAREKKTFFADIYGNVRIKGDRSRINEMILNILMNSIQFSQKGSGIKVYLEEKKSGIARMVFEDTGRGIKKNDLDNLFEPFYTVDSSGVGLGLAIVKSIVDIHNGSIKIKSQSGQGTQVEVNLPLLENNVIKRPAI